MIGAGRHRMHSRIASLLCGAALLMAGGCGSIITDYGKSRGRSGRRSLNGFAALRASFETAGFRNRDVTRLSDRVARTDVIVWTPQVLAPIDSEVTGWFDRWLRSGNRTLVYIVPDSGSETDYWIDAGRVAPPEQRLEYRKRAAKSVNQRMVWRLNRDGIASNGWFRVEPLDSRQPLGDVTGDWDDEVSKSADQTLDASTELRVIEYDPDNPPATTGTGTVTFNAPTGPASPGWYSGDTPTPTKTPIEFNPLLNTNSGDTVLAEITSERWRNSRIIVVAGGSLLTNYAFTRAENRRLADRIVLASKVSVGTDPIAGFLTSSWASVPVSEKKTGVPQATGMELLTVWPLSIVTTHGVMLGLVICLMLLPVFGRPKRVRQMQQSDFGDHLDAVAALMKRAGGEAYARSRISDYMKRMHHETSGPWVLPDPAPKPFSAATLNSPSGNAASGKPPATRPNAGAKQPEAKKGASGSLIDQATAEDELTPPEQLKSSAPQKSDATATASTSPAVAEAPRKRSSAFEIFEEFVFRHLGENAGLEPQRAPKGVDCEGLQIRRSEGNLARLSDSSVLCVLIVDASWSDSQQGDVRVRDLVSAVGSDSKSAIAKAAQAYATSSIGPILSLVKGSPVLQSRQISAEDLAPGWATFSGERVIQGDDQGWLSEHVQADRPLLSLVRDSLQSVLTKSGVHSCSISLSGGAGQRLQLECYFDGVRSPQAEQEIRRQLTAVAPTGGGWRMRQFFTMRPNRDS